MDPAVNIRAAEMGDASAIAEIYNHYVLETTATFDMTPKSPQEHAAWIAKRDAAYPVLVAETGERVVAWGALSAWAQREAWRHTVEVSVYVELHWRGKGIGRALLEELLKRAASAGHHAVISQIVSENEASLRLARSMGFEQVGTLREVGRKFDRWLDVILMEKILPEDG
ncbi:MAG: L-methionine sulfoximine/L-methionine sulfone acetyltransferase [Coriobacteriia bacterium]